MQQIFCAERKWDPTIVDSTIKSCGNNLKDVYNQKIQDLNNKATLTYEKDQGPYEDYELVRTIIILDKHYHARKAQTMNYKLAIALLLVSNITLISSDVHGIAPFQTFCERDGGPVTAAAAEAESTVSVAKQSWCCNGSFQEIAKIAKALQIILQLNS